MPPKPDTTIEITFRDLVSFLQAYMGQIGRGLFIATDTPLPLDACVTLRIRLPDDPDPMEVQGQVVLSNPKARKSYFPRGMGVKLLKMEPGDSEKIEGLLKENPSLTETLSFF